MTLQNRVAPTGEIVAHPARGTLMGNRGVLHDASRQLKSARWTTKAWIACRLEFKGYRRVPMSSGSYTELFFLDEATALAAGHRPCAECRRADYNAFRAAWTDAHRSASRPSAPMMDAALHAERVDPKTRQKLTSRRSASTLPDGAFVTLEGAAWLVLEGHIWRWSFDGYGERRALPESEVDLLTPPSALAAIAAGYAPAIHPSALA